MMEALIPPLFWAGMILGYIIFIWFRLKFDNTGDITHLAIAHDAALAGILCLVGLIA